MKIYKQNDKIIIELDFWQKENNPYMDDKDLGTTHNLIGVIAGDDYTISQLNDLNYKDSQQEGGPLVHFYGSKEAFLKICKEVGIDVLEHEMCVYCHKPIYGTATIGDKGNQCMNCEDVDN